MYNTYIKDIILVQFLCINWEKINKKCHHYNDMNWNDIDITFRVNENFL